MPDALKLLVFKRFDLYQTACENHRLQHTAVTVAERYEAALETVTAMKENWQIWSELNHYAETGEMLGDHLKVKEYNMFELLNSWEKTLSAVDYTKKLMSYRETCRQRIYKLKGMGNKDELITEWTAKFNEVSKRLNMNGKC